MVGTDKTDKIVKSGSRENGSCGFSLLVHEFLQQLGLKKDNGGLDDLKSWWLQVLNYTVDEI